MRKTKRQKKCDVIHWQRGTYNADTFDGEYHSREETGQLLDRREQLDMVDRLDVAENVVERDREAAYHEDVGEHRERHQVLQIAHLTEQDQRRDQREDVETYVYVLPGVEIGDLMGENEMHSGGRKDRSRNLWKGSRQNCGIVSQREKALVCP